MKNEKSAYVPSEVLTCFSAAISSGRLAHAYLLSGPRGAGKSAAALTAAKLVNCQDSAGFRPGCLCSSCVKISSGNHPDVFFVRRGEDKSQILIEQIRDIRERFNLRTWEARTRVGVIVNAEDMNGSAANAFLKTLEEPLPCTLLILTTSAPDRILPTIRSRCQEIPVPARTRSELVKSLADEYHVSLVEAGVMAGFVRETDDGPRSFRGFIGRRDEVVDQFILGSPPYDYIKARTEDKDSSRELLDVVLTFFRDVALAQQGVSPEYFVHADRVPAVSQAAMALTSENVQKIIAGTVSAIKGMRENMNVRLSLIILKEMM